MKRNNALKMYWDRQMALRRFKDGAGATAADTAFPAALPYPDGWFCLGFSRELRAEATLTRQLMGQDVVLARTRDGALKAMRPYCPHLGAHLGVMGRVKGEDITCGFHNMTFSLDGPCVRSGYGQALPRADLTVLPVQETGGVIFVWQSQDGAPPSWVLPELRIAGWQPPLFSTREVATHPQQVMENAIDTGHLIELHGQPSSYCPEISFEGSVITLAGDFLAALPVGRKIRIESKFTMYGLGAIIAEVEVARPRFRTRILVLPTPVAPWRVRLSIAMSAMAVPDHREASRLAELHSTVMARIMRRIIFHLLTTDNNLDFPVWQYQEYQPQPRLAHGDGPIGKYRKWAEQFYSVAEISSPVRRLNSQVKSLDSGNGGPADGAIPLPRPATREVAP
jgi:nitrite reductase/ring-hydroxylating ferredoxin subunit